MIPVREAARELTLTPRQLLKWILKNRIFEFIDPNWKILLPHREFEKLRITLGIGTN
jgi:phage antirepressor YoqD-like protein